ncbi:hypothetical protein NQ317_000872 [Molorchus minor]|uniref:Receptor ligand binding region domain-containing protein n=1 Tax=Molorchus minor TaxID=1323400 RepID=A0ABQ9JUQ2_9CUCU|nr:hypothetical protein NQ317_000872 [Molorchus minor]
MFIRDDSTPFLFTYLPQSYTETFTIGYLTGSQRRPDWAKGTPSKPPSFFYLYRRPGISKARFDYFRRHFLAVEEVNKGPLARKGYKLDFIVAETYGEEIISVQKLLTCGPRMFPSMWDRRKLEHEAFMAAAFNVPMVSYASTIVAGKPVNKLLAKHPNKSPLYKTNCHNHIHYYYSLCTHAATSDKTKFSTFARTRPPDTQISKSVASVLTAFNWTHVVLLYLNSPDFEFGNIATIILSTLSSAGITVIATKYWDTPYHHGYFTNPFYKLIEETYRDTRIFVVLGNYYEHLGLMVAMQDKKLFDKGEYFVVGVDIEQYDSENPSKYLRGLLRDDIDPVAEKAYRSYLGVVPSSPVGFENFASLVNSYMEKPPFNFPNPLTYFGGEKRIRAEAAFLYDAVHLYARALMKVMNNGGNPRNGTAIIDAMKETHYKSAMGTIKSVNEMSFISSYIVYMDENGDAEGNYTLIARKTVPNKEDEEEGYGLFPVGVFSWRRTDSRLPTPEDCFTDCTIFYRPVDSFTTPVDFFKDPVDFFTDLKKLRILDRCAIGSRMRR